MDPSLHMRWLWLHLLLVASRTSRMPAEQQLLRGAVHTIALLIE